jgi:hypothetical protein
MVKGLKGNGTGLLLDAIRKMPGNADKNVLKCHIWSVIAKIQTDYHPNESQILNYTCSGIV